MIPKAFITAWQKKAPWQEDTQVEQDLIIERSVIEIYSDPFLKEKLAFRGGTALHKIFLAPAARYSEDIDLVQITAEPFGPVIDKIRERLDFMSRPIVKQKKNNNTLIYRFDSETGLPAKLKIEINCREHFTLYGLQTVEFSMESEWFSGTAQISTYDLTELLGTKMRALYQRRKGRDLFDLYHAITKTNANTDRIVAAWKRYMQEEGNRVSQTEYLDNMERKMADKDFLGDTRSLLRTGLHYDVEEAYEFVKRELLEKI